MLEIKWFFLPAIATGSATLTINKKDPKSWIIGLVNGFIAKSPLNNLLNKNNDPAWDQALVGFAGGAGRQPACREIIRHGDGGAGQVRPGCRRTVCHRGVE